jgi:MazG family protein
MDPTQRRAQDAPSASANDPRSAAFGRLLAIVDRLRAPDGCPWDRKQTIASMAPHLVEEAHEAVEAIETKGDAEVAEEAGDLLMVIAMICRIAEESGRFDLTTASNAIADKLVRRHPHVFGTVEVDSADEVVKNWEAIKKGERTAKEEDASALAGVPVALPALQRAHRICGKAVSAGFRWSNVAGALAKLDEEQGELREALSHSGLDRDAKAPATPAQRAAVEHELGDVMLAAAFLSTYLSLDPEKLARDAVRRFETRYRTMERALDRPLAEHTEGELIQAWERAKQATP